MEDQIEVVELERSDKGWTFFNPTSGEQVGGPFETEALAVGHADELGWIIQD